MRRLLAILLVAILAVNSFPLAAQARLICRMTGQVMQPVAVQDDPHSCCTIKARASGGAELANRSCCDLRITPGHPPLPSATLPHVATNIAVLPATLLLVPIPELVEIVSPAIYEGTPQYRGPPPSSASPRAPPDFS